MKKAVKNIKTSTKSAKNSQGPIYFRYEFSDETGCPEGGDIFQYSSLSQLEKMLKDVIQVAQGDGVTVSLTLGQEDSFFKYLNNCGLSQKEVENEMVQPGMIPLLADLEDSTPKKAPKKAAQKKNAVVG